MKSTNIFLILLLLALVAAVVGTQFFGKDKQRSFRKDLVSIDTAKVTKMLLYPSSLEGKKLTFQRVNTSSWEVQVADSAAAPAQNDMVKYMLGSLLSVKPKRMAAKSSDKWAEYQVDGDTGTRLKIMEGDKEKLDLHIGKFSMQQNPQRPGQEMNPAQMRQQQQPKMSTFVRLEGDQETYAVDGMLSMTFNRKAEDFIARPVVEEAPAATDSTAATIEVDSTAVE